ncbi:VCBS repeat-containing protein, partial [bacterium]|nr:VCBS repeat-containing protein [bacterium]
PDESSAGVAGGITPTFTDVSVESGFTVTQSDHGFVGDRSQGAAAAVADVDADGDLDVFLPRVGKPNGLYLNDGSGHFTDVAPEAGVAGPSERFGSRASAFFDIEGDGDLDLFAAGAETGNDQLFVNDGSGHFTDEAPERGLDRPIDPLTRGTQQHGVTIGDVNRDGNLDLLVLQWRSELYNSTAIEAAQQTGAWEEDEMPLPCETSAGL